MAKDDRLKVFRKGDVNYIFALRINDARDAIRGEVDIFVSTGTGRSFDKVTVQRPNDAFNYLKNSGKVNSFSWHGNYLEVDGKIKKPKIHLKKDSTKLAWAELDGVINQKEIFLFPIFSVYVPQKLENKNVKRKSRGASQELVLREEAMRIDFFLLPKDIPKDKFMELTISKLYLEFDITMFNRQLRGALISLKGEASFHWYKLKSWWALIRCVYAKEDVPNFSLLFHDTFDPIGCILDRGFCYSAPVNNNVDVEAKPVSKMQLRDIHAKELKELGLR